MSRKAEKAGFNAGRWVARVFVGVIVTITLFLVVVVVVTGWRIAGVRITTPNELFAQSQQMVAVLGFVVAVVVAGATVYYAKLTRDVVAEMREARREDAERDERLRREATAREVRDSVVTLVDATLKVVALTALLNRTLRGNWWVGRRRYGLLLWDRVGDSVFTATASVNRLHVLDPVVANRADELLDLLLDVYRDVAGGQIHANDPRVKRASELREWFVGYLRAARVSGDGRGAADRPGAERLRPT